MHNFHNARKQLPFGATSNPSGSTTPPPPRQTWIQYLWDFLEEKALAGKNDLTKNFQDPPIAYPLGDPKHMQGLGMIPVAIYSCPSDAQGQDQDDPTIDHVRRRANYAVNWGNSKYGQNPEPSGHAPFSHIKGDPSKPRLTKLTMVTDGTSHTLLMSEVLKAWIHTDDDWRGDIYNDQGEFRFNTLIIPSPRVAMTPNTNSPDFLGRITQTGDPLMPATLNSTSDGVGDYTAARSRHRGGVNASFCDGSVRFIADGIQATIWSAMGTMDGAEPTGNYD